jgi:hypothetical protein
LQVHSHALSALLISSAFAFLCRNSSTFGSALLNGHHWPLWSAFISNCCDGFQRREPVRVGADSSAVDGSGVVIVSSLQNDCGFITDGALHGVAFLRLGFGSLISTSLV